MGKKLIEVALPLAAINAAAAKEKSIRHGHPSTLHLWWARRPLAACRAVLFASLVDDPSARPDEFPTAAAQEAARERLFDIIEELVKWENTTNETVLTAARAEILKATGGAPPPVLDPFCGGGSIPLEAQRLGLEAHASDLNPVAVLITKALIEIPPKFANCPPVHPVEPGQQRSFAQREWRGAQGLAEDVRHYGKWMRDEAERRIGHLYPKVRLPNEQGGGEATVIAWLWARTVHCPNPACGARMPLVRSFALSTKKGKEVWAEPVIDRARTPPAIGFAVKSGKGNPPEGTVNRRGVTCIACGASAPLDHVRAEGKGGRMNAQLLAIVAEGAGGRAYLAPTEVQAQIAQSAQATWQPETSLPEQALGFRVQLYGMTRHADLFTPRQLVALTTFSDLVTEVRGCIMSQAGGDAEYAAAVATYAALAVDRLAESSCTLARWQSTGDFVAGAFSRQALSMLWDYAEVNPFSRSTRNFLDAVEWVAEVIDTLPISARPGTVDQRDAASGIDAGLSPMVSTDPPYYDNVPYADLSDFFYVWLRNALKSTFPQLFSTLLVPKSREIVADPYRHGGREQAQQFFEEGLGNAFKHIRQSHCRDYPLSVYYAFKQAESDADDGAALALASTGWETMLEGLLTAGFCITGTWPMHTERTGRLRETGSNALASSIVLVCRPRPADAPTTTRRAFIDALRRELPAALRTLQHGNIAPVDLAQAAIGPGMAVFSRHARVLEADGTPMRVRTALQLINQALDEVLAEQEGEFDADTRFALAWFEQAGLNDGPFGEADVLARAKNTSVQGLAEAGVLAARGGKVRLLRRDELAADWDPAKDKRRTVWEVAQHLIRALEEGGELAAAALLRRLGADGEVARDLAYRLYTTCERKGWAQEALAYNSLVVTWPELSRLASQTVADEQTSFLR